MVKMSKVLIALKTGIASLSVVLLLTASCCVCPNVNAEEDHLIGVSKDIANEVSNDFISYRPFYLKRFYSIRKTKNNGIRYFVTTSCSTCCGPVYYYQCARDLDNFFQANYAKDADSYEEPGPLECCRAGKNDIRFFIECSKPQP